MKKKLMIVLFALVVLSFSLTIAARPCKVAQGIRSENYTGFGCPRWHYPDKGPHK